MTATAGMSFFLDREGHKKFLEVSTNQELQERNEWLEAQNETLEDSNKELKRVKDSFVEVVVILQEQKDSLKDQLESENFHVTELEDSIDSLVAENEAAENRVIQLEAECKRNKALLDVKESQADKWFQEHIKLLDELRKGPPR